MSTNAHIYNSRTKGRLYDRLIGDLLQRPFPLLEGVQHQQEQQFTNIMSLMAQSGYFPKEDALNES